MNGKELLIGNEKLLNKYSISIEVFEPVIKNYSSIEMTFVFVAVNKQLEGLLILEDEIKDNSTEIISELKKMNLKTVLLTGDNKKAAEIISQRVGFDDFSAEVLPEDKLKIIKEYQNKGKIIAMVGDGINDAPALAQSNVGIAMGTGTDIAIESADIILTGGNLDGVIKALRLSRLTIATIKQNLFWAFIYNIIGVPLAAFGFLNPMIAALAMSLSSVSVVTNSLRLRRKKI
jgi:Cu+-exporting ATPase